MTFFFGKKLSKLYIWDSPPSKEEVIFKKFSNLNNIFSLKLYIWDSPPSVIEGKSLNF